MQRLPRGQFIFAHEVVEHPEWSIAIRNRGMGVLLLRSRAGVVWRKTQELESVLCRGLFIV